MSESEIGDVRWYSAKYAHATHRVEKVRFIAGHKDSAAVIRNDYLFVCPLGELFQTEIEAHAARAAAFLKASSEAMKAVGESMEAIERCKVEGVKTDD